MVAFSPRNLEVVLAFAASMDIHRIVPAHDGSVTFEISNVGTLCFTPSPNGRRLLISLKRVARYPQVEDLKRFFALSRWDSYLTLPINAGMGVDGSLILMGGVEEMSVTPQIIDQCIDRLADLHDRWASNL